MDEILKLSVVRETGLEINVMCCFPFFVIEALLNLMFCHCFSLPPHASGNDSVVASSADSHPHPLQDRTLQVSVPHQGQ